MKFSEIRLAHGNLLAMDGESASKERILKRSCGFFITPVDRILIHLKR